jgi:hypothetical protein
VGVVDGAGHRLDQLGGIVSGQRPARQLLVKAGAVDPLLGNQQATVVLTDLVDGGQVQVMHPCRRLDGGPLPRTRLGSLRGRADAEDHEVSQLDMPRLEGDAAGAAPHFTEDLVIGPRRQAHRCNEPPSLPAAVRRGCRWLGLGGDGRKVLVLGWADVGRGHGGASPIDQSR